MKYNQKQKGAGTACINAYNFEFLRERYNEEYSDFTDQFDEAVTELKRFFTLIFSTTGPLAAMSHAVDGLWHTFILHTPQYEAFCKEVFGEFIHHQPRSTTIPVPISAISTFYKEYPKQYGLVPSIWFKDIPIMHHAAVAKGKVPLAVQNLKWSGWPGWKVK